MRTWRPRSRPKDVVVVAMSHRVRSTEPIHHPVSPVSGHHHPIGWRPRGPPGGEKCALMCGIYSFPEGDCNIAFDLVLTSGRSMPIPRLVKTALRKDLVLGGLAGTLLIGGLVAVAVSIAPMLGVHWPGQPAEATPGSVNLPAIAPSRNPVQEAAVRRPRRAARPTPARRQAAAPA